MLIITRNPGQSVQIGDISVKVLGLSRHVARLEIDGKPLTLRDDMGAVKIAEGITLIPKQIQACQMRLGINAPRDVPIARDDYLDKAIKRLVCS